MCHELQGAPGGNRDQGDTVVVMGRGTHIQAPVPGRPTLLATTCGHCGVSEAMAVDPHCAHPEPVGRMEKSERTTGSWSAEPGRGKGGCWGRGWNWGERGEARPPPLPGRAHRPVGQLQCLPQPLAPHAGAASPRCAVCHCQCLLGCAERGGHDQRPRHLQGILGAQGSDEPLLPKSHPLEHRLRAVSNPRPRR